VEKSEFFLVWLHIAKSCKILFSWEHICCNNYVAHR
jgi:hypothetical protein